MESRIKSLSPGDNPAKRYYGNIDIIFDNSHPEVYRYQFLPDLMSKKIISEELHSKLFLNFVAA